MSNPIVTIDLSEYNSLLDIKKKYESGFKSTELNVHHENGNYFRIYTYSNDEVAPKFSEIEIEREAAYYDCKKKLDETLESVRKYNNNGSLFRFSNKIKL